MNKVLPIYKLTIKEDTTDESGVFAISLVDNPAIEKNWLAFAQEQPKFEFKIVEQDKQVLAGYFMIPDKMIYQNDNGKEYMVVFDKETIEKISEKFNRNKFSSEFNIQHSDLKVSAFVKENWIVESETDKSSKYGFTSIVGGWFGLVKVEDKVVWTELIKQKTLNGFSVEGFFDMELQKYFKQEPEPIKFGSIKTTCGNEITFQGAMIYQGAEVNLPDGLYELETGMFAFIKDKTLKKLSETRPDPMKEFFKNIYKKHNT